MLKIFEYKDRNGTTIKENMYLKHIPTGEKDLVYKCDSGDFGFCATNKKYKYNNSSYIEIYPLSEFFLNEWEVVE